MKVIVGWVLLAWECLGLAKPPMARVSYVSDVAAVYSMSMVDVFPIIGHGSVL